MPKKFTTEEWIEACREKRPDFEDYNFSKVEYVNNRTKVLIIHKDYPEYPWEVRPKNFKDLGEVHPMINGKYRWTTEEWIEACREKRPDFEDYNFSKVKYINSFKKVLIIHKDYPEYPWEVSPNAFKDNGKCHPLLHKGGYSRTDFKNACLKNNKGKGFLYLIYFICQKSREQFCKIGITSRSVKERFCSKQYNHLKIKKTVLLEQQPALIYDLENEILREYKKYKFNPTIPFEGKTECLSYEAWNIILKEKLAQYLIT